MKSVYERLRDKRDRRAEYEADYQTYDSMKNAINWGIAIMAFLFVVIQLVITLLPYFLK